MKKLKAALSRWRRKTGDSSVIANDDFVFLSDMKTHSDKDLPKQRLSIALGWIVHFEFRQLFSDIFHTL